MATALDDFVAPDCRFINIKRGQTVYVYSKLLPVEGAGVFWSGSVCARFDLSLALSARSVPGTLSVPYHFCTCADRCAWSRNTIGSRPLWRMRQLFLITRYMIISTISLFTIAKTKYLQFNNKRERKIDVSPSCLYRCTDKRIINMPFYIRLQKNKAVHTMGLLEEATLHCIYI